MPQLNLVNDFLIPAIVYGCLYSLVATSFNVLERSTKVLNFANGYLIMWAPMAALVATIQFGLPPAVGLALGIIFAIGLSLLVELITIRPFVGQEKNMSWILTTYGASVILGQLASAPFDAQDEPFTISLSLNPIRGIGLSLSPQKLLLIGITIVVAVGVFLLYRRTKLGKRLDAVSEDFEGARVIGISPGRMSSTAAGISALVGAIAGLAFAPILLVSPSLGAGLTFPGFVAAALGGLGSLGGGFLGAFVVGIVIQASAVLGFSQWSDAVLFSVLLIVFLVRPWGVFGHRPSRAV